MKKILVILSVLFFAGCSMLDISNTPTKKVEEYLNKFQILDKEVLDQLDEVIDRKINLNDENKKEYRELIKKQYKDLQYSIKDEETNGDEAIVTAEIIVKDFTKVINDTEVYKREHISEFYVGDIYDDNLYKKYLIDKLKDSKDKVTYTIDFSVHKSNGKWKMEPINSVMEDKILGIYNYND